MAINPNSIAAWLWQRGVPGIPQPSGGRTFVSSNPVAPAQGSREAAAQNSSFGSLVPQGQQTQPEFGTWATPDYHTGPVSLGRSYAGGTGAPVPWETDQGGGGAGAFNPPPDLAKYFDATGEYKIQDPREVAADAGISLSQLMGGIMPRYGDKYGRSGQGYDFPSDKGGFFRIEDVYGQTGTPTPGENASAGGRTDAIPIPQAATFGQNRPSTNNWRLLGRGPGYIMRNGFIIKTQDPGGRQGGFAGWVPGSVSGEQHVSGYNYGTPLGAGSAYGLPNVRTNVPGVAGSFGWPGAETWVGFGGSNNAGIGG